MNGAALVNNSGNRPILIPGWLRNVSFDSTFIIGVAALALLAGTVSDVKPSLFQFILFWDLWFLGYHHVVATFTRLTFDRASFNQYKFLIVWLPVIVAAATVGAFFLIGTWTLATTYLYWQWFHYTRQSYGISRIYQCKVNPQNSKIDQGVIYILPLAGILYRSFQNPSTFLDMEVKCLPVPGEVVQVLFLLSGVVLFLWVIKQVIALKKGQSSLAYSLFMFTHIIIFTVGYILIDDINHGWLALNVWHNAQYIMFVWLYNNKRFKNGVDPDHFFLSYLSQAKNQWRYYTVCFGLSTIIYFFLQTILGFFHTSTLPLALVVYQTINFHHYIVDGIIWKVRQKPVRKTMELSENIS